MTAGTWTVGAETVMMLPFAEMVEVVRTISSFTGHVPAGQGRTSHRPPLHSGTFGTAPAETKQVTFRTDTLTDRRACSETPTPRHHQSGRTATIVWIDRKAASWT